MSWNRPADPRPSLSPRRVLVRAKVAAERIGVSPATMKRWLLLGRVPGGMKVGKNWKVPLDTIDAILRGELVIDATLPRDS